jgi:hypothetical protein
MKLPLKALLAATALGFASIATPAFADIIPQPSSADQGTLVHTDGEEQGTDVTATLGSGPTAPLIVHFQGTTDAAAPDPNNVVHLQQGNGQAELTGIELGGNDAANLLSGDIFLNALGSGFGSPSDPTNLGMEWIELAFQGVTADSVLFTLTLADGEPNFIQSFLIDHSPNGENKFAFQAINGESILNLHYAFTGGSADALRQVRIASTEGGVPPVPEASTWAMMLIGFGAVGYSMRRRRKTYMPQVA